MKKLILIPLLLVGVVALLIGGLLVYSIITDYQPTGVEEGIRLQQTDTTFNVEEPIKILTYNIGYGGLDINQDFFMEGGNKSKSESKEKTMENLNGMASYVKTLNPDIIAFQEIDWKAMRSFDINEAEFMVDQLGKDYSASFAYNFKVNWIPKPWLDPIGYVQSGMLTMAKAESLSTNRHALSSEFPIPDRFFMLDRCLLVDEYPLSNGKTLTFINLHLSAYDPGGSLRDEQLEYLLAFINTIDLEDHYVVLAGDWNMVLGNASVITNGAELPEWYSEIPEWFEDANYVLASDADVMTSRTNEQPYVKGENMELVIDGFYVSPNIEVVETVGLDTGYQYADHNPVMLTIKFKQ